MHGRSASRSQSPNDTWKDRDRFVAEAIGELADAGLGEAARLIDAITERTLASLADRAAADAARGDDAGDGERAPLVAVEHGRLRFVGAARIELRGARIKDLYRATFHGKRPQIAVEPDGLVTLLEVTGIDITGGASECELALPRPHAHATLRITGGSSQLVVKRPRGTAAQILIRGGASSFVFDDQRIGAVGGAIRLSTPGWDSAPDRWTIELNGGASSLSVTEL